MKHMKKTKKLHTQRKESTEKNADEKYQAYA